MKNTFSIWPCVAAIALLLSPPQALAAAHKDVLKYDVYAGGFQALKGGLSVDTTDGAYKVTLHAETKNFIGDLFPWSGDYEAHGHVSHDKPVPQQFVSKSIWKKSLKTVQMDYNNAGKLLKFSSLQGGKTTVTEEFKPELLSMDPVDMMTATLMMFQSVTEHNACEGSFPVFDGKRRFNIKLKDAGTAVITKSKYSVFEGDALRCALTVEPVAGFKKRDYSRGWMAVQAHTQERAKLPTIWFAKVTPDSPMLPVRMEINSAYGGVIAHLASVGK